MRELIGRGTFTRAYKIAEDKVELISTCVAKECYSMFSEGNPFAPVVERNFDKENSYFMPLYPKVTAPKQQLNKGAYTLYKALRSLPLGLDYYKFCKAIETLAELTEDEKENLVSLASDVCNGIDTLDLRFEISPRNITCDNEGNLILLDCFFCIRALKAIKY